MNLKAIAATLAVAGLCVSTAVAAPPPGKGKSGSDTTATTTTTTTSHGKKPSKTGASCKPSVSVVLTGTLAADGAAAPSSISVTVKGGNKAGRAYKAAAQPVAVAITSGTRVNRNGKHDPALLKSGDRVNVQAKACKADLANGGAPALTATRVTANPAKASGGDTTTTTTTTTTP